MKKTASKEIKIELPGDLVEICFKERNNSNAFR